MECEGPGGRASPSPGASACARSPRAPPPGTLPPHNVFLKSSRKSEFPHKIFNVFFMLVIVNDKLTYLWGSQLSETKHISQPWGECMRSLATRASSRYSATTPPLHNVFLKSFGKSRLPQRCVDLFFILVLVKDKLSNLWGS